MPPFDGDMLAAAPLWEAVAVVVAPEVVPGAEGGTEPVVVAIMVW